MQPVYTINPQLDIPIYQQLVDILHAAIRRGTLEPHEQLPTVQELSRTLGVAIGTVKRAYDELDREGLIVKIQGRGTFVRYQPSRSESSKEQAMAAIDSLLDSLEKMGFSPAQINIFLNLKLRERAEQESRLKVALVECNAENLSVLTDQLRPFPSVDVYAFLLENVEQYPYKLEEDFDLIVTTAEHAPYLERTLPDRRKVAKVALRLTANCMSRIIKLKRDMHVGILCYSPRFGNLLHRTCQEYTEDISLSEPMVFSTNEAMRAYLQGLDVVLLPLHYEKYCSAEVAKMLSASTLQRIECSYEIDAGSSLYLQEKFHRALEKKTL